MTEARCYLLTGFIVLVGAVYGSRFIQFCDEHESARHGNLILSLSAWDGEWYEKIASQGYSYDPERQSSVAFYPAYPVVAAAIAKLSGLSTLAALLIVSNASFLLALILLGKYVLRELRDVTVLAAGLLPTTFYFRMAYSESLFLLLCVAAMLGMVRRWPSLCIAAIIGAACATRPLGVALLPPFAMYLFPEKRDAVSLLKFSGQAAVLLPIACWGIFAYSYYQWLTFGDAVAFLKTQRHWGQPAAGHVWRLLTLAPVRAVYDPASSCYWGHRPPKDAAMFNMMFANPIYYLATIGAVLFGSWKRWLTAREIALSAGLLLIPYATQADRMCMASMARFASVAFPVYIVVGNVLTRLPGPVVGVLSALSATMLAIYTAMFVNWYWYY